MEMKYTKVRLSDLQVMGDLVSLPGILVGMPEHQRLDASWLGEPYVGFGYFDRLEVRMDLGPLQRYGEPEVVVDATAGTVTYTYPAEPMYESERQSVLEKALADLAEARWKYEIAGILYTRPSDGKVFGISTDRESQGKLVSERAAAVAGIRATGDVWKCYDVAADKMVFEPFTDSEIIEIANSARKYVADAFKHEGDLAALIEAGDPTVVWTPPPA